MKVGDKHLRLVFTSYSIMLKKLLKTKYYYVDNCGKHGKTVDNMVDSIVDNIK